MGVCSIRSCSSSRAHNSFLLQCSAGDVRHWFCSSDPARTRANKDVLAALSMVYNGSVVHCSVNILCVCECLSISRSLMSVCFSFFLSHCCSLWTCSMSLFITGERLAPWSRSLVAYCTPAATATTSTATATTTSTATSTTSTATKKLSTALGRE